MRLGGFIFCLALAASLTLLTSFQSIAHYTTSLAAIGLKHYNAVKLYKVNTMSLSLPSQLLLQQELSDNVLLINPPSDDLFLSIPKTWQVASFSFANKNTYEKRGFINHKIDQPIAEKFDHIIVFLPKAKQRIQYTTHFAQHALSENGEMWFVGENKGGIKSLAKNLKKDFAQADKFTSGKHSAIVSCSGPLNSIDFNPENYYTQQKNELGLDLKALPGVFSQDHLDKGTQVLLDNMPRKIKGRVLDFGCGAGVIGAFISQNREFEEIDMLDDDLLAVKSAQLNIEKNKIPYTQAQARNGLGEVTERYSWIISNPPFHQGVKTDYNATETFLTEAKNHLKLSGKLCIVFNEFLNYETILREHFKGINVVAKDKGFKVVVCEGIMRPKTR
jgi:16S rRNA (guanine1207-N2)-methyltransferase